METIGLTSSEAAARLKTYGLNSLKPPKKGKGITLFFSQFKSPLILLLIAAAILASILGDRTDTTVILGIVFLSGVLGFFQERGALNALEKLLRIIENKALVLRDGKEIEISFEKIVPGDVVILNAGDLIPADCVLIEAKHFFANESMLTGESIPVEKEANNPLYMGTMVASGIGKALVKATGKNTQYSELVQKIRSRHPQTAFEKGVSQFGYLLIQITFVLVVVIFGLNVYLKKPVIESFLFSLAIAVGLTPQLLPAIISVNLSHGARRMAKKHVIVKRLPSIENFGQMDILCADKTGTLTEGKIKLDRAVDGNGQDNQKASSYGFLNAHFQAGYANPLDKAILEKLHLDANGWQKIDEIPYDFERKRLSVALKNDGKQLLIAKGAAAEMFSICDRMERSDGTIMPIDTPLIEKFFDEESKKGFRLIALAYGENEEEKNLIFLGFLIFFDPIKPDLEQTIEALKKTGVSLKIITGDHPLVAQHVGAAFHLHESAIITGAELREINDTDLIAVVAEKEIFAQIEPNQKQRIIIALQRSGHVVGYLGDGVNDVSALHSADVGIAVDSGADAAKEVADIVLLKKDLHVLREGIEEGRRTFVNTLKYVYMASSANLGNMFSMAGISLFINFLPLLPKQVLLNNFLSDFPEMALAADHVDAERVKRPVQWELPRIRRFMFIFGLISSIPDFLTFGILLFWFKADETFFQTGWFIESVVTASLIVLAIRTRRLFWRSKPARLLLFAVLAVAIGVLFLPFTPFGKVFNLSPLPLPYYGALAGLIIFYVASVEVAKRLFFAKRI